MIDLVALRLAPSLAAGLIAYSHMGLGQGLIVFCAVVICTQVIERSQLPLHLMPASRIILGLAAPVVGTGVAWLISVAVGVTYPIGDLVPVVLGAWLVMALGAWVKARQAEGLKARVAVIGSREFAADFVGRARGRRRLHLRRHRMDRWPGSRRVPSPALARDARRDSPRRGRRPH